MSSIEFTYEGTAYFIFLLIKHVQSFKSTVFSLKIVIFIVSLNHHFKPLYLSCVPVGIS